MVPQMEEMTRSRRGVWGIQGVDLCVESQGLTHAEPPFKLVLQVDGQAEIQQLGRKTRMTAWDVSLIDSSVSFRIAMDGPFQQIVVAIPRALIT